MCQYSGTAVIISNRCFALSFVSSVSVGAGARKTERELEFELTRSHSHSHSFSVPPAGLFSEPFLRDLDLLWNIGVLVAKCTDS